MPHPITTTVTLAAASANGIALAQTLGAAGPLTLNGAAVTAGVATLDSPRRVVIHSIGNDSGITFTVTGTGGAWLGAPVLRETIAGAAAGGDAVTTQDFLTVTSITASGATAANVTAGTNGAAAGPWVVWDAFPPVFNISISGFVISGAPTWGVEYTYDDVFGLWLPPGVPFARALPFGLMAGLTGQMDGKMDQRVFATRLALTAAGSVMLTQQQQSAG